METQTLTKDIKVFGLQVVRFPQGIKQVFDELMHAVPDGSKRACYGLSHMDKDGNIVYYAAVEEKADGEGKKLGYDYYTIPHGKYLAETIKDWHTNITCIKDAFEELMKDKRFDHVTPCIEWYKSDNEVTCMVKTKSSKK